MAMPTVNTGIAVDSMPTEIPLIITGAPPAKEASAIERVGAYLTEVKNSVEKILKNYPAHVCGIQVHWYLYCGGAVHIANLYKKLFPDSKIFLGGYMATAFWREFLNSSKDIDGVILGEGEKVVDVIPSTSVEEIIAINRPGAEDTSEVSSPGRSP